MTNSLVTFDPEIKLKTILRRYMDVPKLLDLLHSRTLYARRADGFSDRLEGALFPQLRESINRAHANGESPYNADAFYKRAREGHYVNCWTLSGKDSMALWQLYGDVAKSITVTTTFERLARVACSWERPVHFYRVNYVDHPRVRTFLVGNPIDVLRFKHEAYQHEKELRVVVPHNKSESDAKGMRLPIPDLDVLVRSIVVAPEASNEFFNAISDLCSKYGLTAPVRRSKLAFVSV